MEPCTRTEEVKRKCHFENKEKEKKNRRLLPNWRNSKLVKEALTYICDQYEKYSV